MDFIQLTLEEQIPALIELSDNRPQVIFKHSTRCNISSIALSRLQKMDTSPNADFYYLDLIRYRNLSNIVADSFQVHHESPQVILIRKKECVYSESHLGIIADEILEQL